MEAQSDKPDGHAWRNDSAGGAVLLIVRDGQLVVHVAAADPGEERELLAMLDSYCLARVSDAVLRCGRESAPVADELGDVEHPAIVHLLRRLNDRPVAAGMCRGGRCRCREDQR
jgi:hypothetical protein